MAKTLLGHEFIHSHHIATRQRRPFMQERHRGAFFSRQASTNRVNDLRCAQGKGYDVQFAVKIDNNVQGTTGLCAVIWV